MRAFPYACPHCGANQFLSYGKGYAIEVGYKELELVGLPNTDDKKETCIGHSVRASVCALCFEPSIELDIVLKAKDEHGRDQRGHIRIGHGSTIKTYYKGRIYPDATIPTVHASVPKQLAEDYKEAWSILERSPRSSAVLARRCIQGAIRDFCEINGRTLNLEISELSDRYEKHTLEADCAPYVTAELIDVLDKVRKMGNIGAHMEKDVNKVIPIDPREAAILLQLVGTLFADWYKARSDRQERLKQLAKIVATKDAAKKAVP